MKPSFSHNPSDLLHEIQRLDAPPFLLTRIKEKVARVYEQKVTPAFATASVCMLLLVFVLNIWIIKAPAPEATPLQKSGQLMFFTNNSLYD